MRLLLLLIASLLVIAYLLQRKESFTDSINIYPSPDINVVTLIVDNNETTINIDAPNVDLDKTAINSINVDTFLETNELKYESVSIINMGEKKQIQLNQGKQVLVIETEQKNPGLYIDFSGKGVSLERNENIDMTEFQKEAQTEEQTNYQIEAQKFLLKGYINGDPLDEVLEEAVAISKGPEIPEGDDEIEDEETIEDESEEELDENLDDPEYFVNKNSTRGLAPVIKRLKVHLPKNFQ